MIDQLVFDTTERADTHTVGAVLYDKANDRLGVINAANELTVHDQSVLDQLTTGVVVTATDLDIRDLILTQDSVSVGDGTNLFTSGGGVGDVAAGYVGMDTNSFGYLWDDTGTTWERAQSNGSGAMLVDIVDASITVEDVALAETSMVAAKEPANTAATAQALTTTLTGIKYRELYNNDNKKLYIGGTGVTDATGYPLSPGNYRQFRASESVDIYWVSAKAGHDVRTLELN